MEKPKLYNYPARMITASRVQFVTKCTDEVKVLGSIL